MDQSQLLYKVILYYTSNYVYHFIAGINIIKKEDRMAYACL